MVDQQLGQLYELMQAIQKKAADEAAEEVEEVLGEKSE
jgi:hypothetical protein